MIVSKNQNKKEESFEPDISVTVTDGRYITEQEAIAGNALEDLYYAVASIIKKIPQNPEDPDSQPLFKTVKWNTGQLNRIRNTHQNTEYGMALPMCLIHYINVYWNLGNNRIGQAYAQMRICYVLNRLNNQDDEFLPEGTRVFKQIIEALNDNLETKLSPLVTRFQLSYWDQVESFDHGVQQYWITYEVRFNDYSTYRYKKYKAAYLVAPPFTNFDDMDVDKNVDNKENVDRSIDIAAGFTSSGRASETPSENENPT